MKRNKLLLILIMTISLLILVVVSFICLLISRVKKEYSIETGQEISIEAYRRYSWDKGAFVWIEKPDTSVPGLRTGKIQVFPITYQVTLMVKEPGTADVTPTEPAYTETPSVTADTEAPEVTVQKVTAYVENELEIQPEQFIVQIQDASECTVEYLTAPNMEAYGVQNVRLLVKDAAGNSTEVESELVLCNVKKNLVLEVGEELPQAEAFLAASGSDISFITDMSTISTMAEGSYEVSLLVDDIEAVSRLAVKDTTAPTLVLCAAEAWLNKPLEPTAFVDFELTTDNSDAFESAFAVCPDWTQTGEQSVSITATDASGNSTTETTTVTIKKDEKAPVVTVTDIDVKVGGTVSYKKAVSYYDDVDAKEEMKLSIERTGVNLNEVGTYEVTYTVTDCSGNATSVAGKINVLAEEPKWEDEEAIHSKAQEILDSILKDDMTDREKAKKIYTWVKSNIGYISHSEKGNYIRGAYEGLFKKEGDCFVYAATAKELLTLAGIQNIDIVKATKNPSHYWNLVYIEDGWYHFDSTPRKDKSEFFLLTDAELEAYSSTHKNTHIFDRSLYPEIK